MLKKYEASIIPTRGTALVEEPGDGVDVIPAVSGRHVALIKEESNRDVPAGCTTHPGVTWLLTLKGWDGQVRIGMNDGNSIVCIWISQIKFNIVLCHAY